MSEQLITKYRPSTFSEVVGNTALIQALANAIRRPGRPRGYLFTGISGIGKTTLARIIARELDAQIEEINAATHSGVENVRHIVNICGFTPITGQSARLIIVDEAQCLFKHAWNAFLKLVEDSAGHNYFAFCSTDPTAIPDTIKTRCFPVALKPLAKTELRTYITSIAEREKWTVQPGVLDSIVVRANGSPRMALSLLEAGHDAKSASDIAEILPPTVAHSTRLARNAEPERADDNHLRTTQRSRR